jgi:hypothetical protein
VDCTSTPSEEQFGCNFSFELGRDSHSVCIVCPLSLKHLVSVDLMVRHAFPVLAGTGNCLEEDFSVLFTLKYLFLFGIIT